MSATVCWLDLWGLFSICISLLLKGKLGCQYRKCHFEKWKPKDQIIQLWACFFKATWNSQYFKSWRGNQFLRSRRRDALPKMENLLGFCWSSGCWSQRSLNCLQLRHLGWTNSYLQFGFIYNGSSILLFIHKYYSFITILRSQRR